MSKGNVMTQIKVLDTTLRDGQQCPGAGMRVKDNFAYAELAYEFGIDILEAGFPAASLNASGFGLYELAGGSVPAIAEI